MSIYKRKNGIYHYDFRISGSRFHGSTGKRSKREAQAFEDSVRESQIALGTARKKPVVMTVQQACAIYMAENGQYHSGHKNTLSKLQMIVSEFGASTPLIGLDEPRIRTAIARWRMTKEGKLRTATTINHEFIERLRAVWNHVAPREPQPEWKRLKLKENSKPIRPASEDELPLLLGNLREDMRPVFLFATIQGTRLGNTIGLKWPQINWQRREASFVMKGGKHHTITLTDESMAILQSCYGHHPEFVFTFVMQKASHGRRKGERVPMTVTALRKQWEKARDKSGLENMRWHDLRHTAASRALAACGNIATVKEMLGHSNIQTTMIYAHTNLSQVREAMNSLPRLTPIRDVKKKQGKI